MTAKKTPPSRKTTAAKKTVVKKRGGGRPTKFTAAIADQARFLAEKGCTDAEIARFFKVTEQTVNNWKSAHSEFFEALKLGKEISDNAVERSLFERATGYSHPDVHISNFQGVITVTPVTKHYAPDTTACIFWLKNRKKEEWRDKQEIDLGGNVVEKFFESLQTGKKLRNGKE